MSDIELVVKRSKKIETLLSEKLNAVGKGLHEKLSSVESLIPDNIVRDCRHVATIRNRVVHDDDFNFENISEFSERSEAVILYLVLLDKVDRSEAKESNENISEQLVEETPKKYYRGYIHLNLSQLVFLILVVFIIIVGLIILRITGSSEVQYFFYFIALLNYNKIGTFSVRVIDYLYWFCGKIFRF